MYEFKRYPGISLGDQLNNPGALNTGTFAKRYDGLLSLEATKGNFTAVFESFPNGVAALMDRMLSDWNDYDGVTVKEYISGGSIIPPEKSYSGGQDYFKYLDAIEQYGYQEEEFLTDERTFLRSMVDAHSAAEGNKYRVTHEDFDLAVVLISHRSPNVDWQLLTWR